MGRLPGAVVQDSIPSLLVRFVDAEVQARVVRGGFVQWADVGRLGGQAQPCLGMALSAEETKARQMYDARPLNMR